MNMRLIHLIGLLILIATLLLTGCAQEKPLEYGSIAEEKSEEIQQPSSELQDDQNTSF